MEFDWTKIESTIQAKEKEETQIIKYLKYHFQKNGTINDIDDKYEVCFEGKTLKIGMFLADYRKKHQAYIDSKEKLTKIPKKFQFLELLNIDWKTSENQLSYPKLARKHGLIKKTLKKYTEKFNGDIDKAIKICIELRKHSAAKEKIEKNDKITLKTIQEIFGLNQEQLESLLNRSTLKIDSNTKSYKYDVTETIKQYCVKHSLDYTTISKAINLKLNDLSDESLESLITRSIWERNNNTQISTWIYYKYGNETLLKYFLLSINLEPKNILVDMTKKAIPIETAIEQHCFSLKSNQEYNYIEPIYYNLVKFYKKLKQNSEYTEEASNDILNEYIINMVNSFHLTEKEVNVIKETFEHYIESIHEYHLYDVGFEKDEDKKLEKIIKYQLDEDEIEEAYFYPLKFDKNVLIGRNNELYKRRTIIKNLTVQWNYLSIEEKESKSKAYNITPEEKNYIEKTRQQIDKVKEKIYKTN